MTQVDETPTRRRRTQFSLATLLAVVTAIAVFTGVGCWIGWWNVYAILVVVDWIGLILVAILPIVVMMLGCSGKVKEHIGKALVVAGTLLAISLVFTGLSVELLHLWDRSLATAPSAVLVWWTLHVSVPAAAAGLLIAIALGKTVWRTRAFFIGASLITIGVPASVWYGYYFFGKLFGISLVEYVWWL